MPEQTLARRLPLSLAFGERGEHDAHAPVADRPAEGCEHLISDLDVAEPEPAIVALDSDLAVEGAGMDVEDILDPHGGELTGLLGEQISTSASRSSRVSAQP